MRSYIVEDGYNTYTSAMGALQSILKKNGASVVFEHKADSCDVYLVCPYWVSKKVFLQTYSNEWSETEMLLDQQQKIAAKFGSCIRKLEWHSYA